jgi:hypothetical protein
LTKIPPMQSLAKSQIASPPAPRPPADEPCEEIPCRVAWSSIAASRDPVETPPHPLASAANATMPEIVRLAAHKQLSG